MSYWNYRAVRVIWPDKSENWEIRTVYYDNDGTISGYSGEVTYPIGDTFEELTSDLSRMKDDVENRDELTLYVSICNRCGIESTNLNNPENVCSDCKKH